MSGVARPGLGLCPLIDVLPVEIRVQIYEYILFENGSFFALDDEEGNSVPILFPKLRPPPRKSEPEHSIHQCADAQGATVSGDGRRKGGNIMSLLLASKLV